MTTGILKEPISENRVSLLPEQAATLSKQKIQVIVEKNAGANAYATDETYAAKEFVVASREEVLQQSGIILSINVPAKDDWALIKPGTILLGVYQPLFNAQLMQ